MSAQIDAPKYTYLKRGVYYFVICILGIFYADMTDACSFNCKKDDLKALQGQLENDRVELELMSNDTLVSEFPNQFFAGFGSKWFLNIHSWTFYGTGKDRYFALTREQINELTKVAPFPIRLQFNVENFLFWAECRGDTSQGYEIHNICYDDAYAEAHENGWKQFLQEDASKISEHPMIELYLSAIQELVNAGLPVIIVPTDFFWGGGSDWTNAKKPPLLYQYLDGDPNFQKVYIKFANALVSAIVREGITDISFQSSNEPRSCPNGRPNLAKWQSLERRIFAAVRLAAPNIHLIGTAVCTAGHSAIKGASRLKRLDDYIAIHSDLHNISYAVHFRNPRLLHEAEYQDLSLIRYPYQKVDIKKDDEVNPRILAEYDRLKPNRTHYAQLFRDMREFADEKGINLIITEWSVSKSDYGLPSEDRFHLMSDILEEAAESQIPILYNGLFGRAGLGLGFDNYKFPAEKFDPKLLSLWEKVNQR